MKLKKKRIYVWCPNTEKKVDLDKRKRVRCPICGRRLLPREVYETEGSWDIETHAIGFELPPHKTYKVKA
jgi:hypothetical protein